MTPDARDAALSVLWDFAHDVRVASSDSRGDISAGALKSLAEKAIGRAAELVPHLRSCRPRSSPGGSR